jgi:hypothetical protein
MGLMYKTENHLMGYIGVATIVHVHHSKIMSEESTHNKRYTINSSWNFY